jgi:hypothetical protein
MVGRVMNLFIGVQVEEGWRSGEEMVGVGGVFKAFNVVDFMKRNGEGDASYCRGRGGLGWRLISVRSDAARGRGVVARGQWWWCTREAMTAWLEVVDEADGGLAHVNTC